jgi:hypothetical protein
MGCYSRLLAAQAMIPEMPVLCNEGPQRGAYSLSASDPLTDGSNQHLSAYLPGHRPFSPAGAVNCRATRKTPGGDADHDP